MIRFVLDASIALSWVVDKPVPSYANGVKQDLHGGARAIVPPLWHTEIANVLVVSERRRFLTAAEIDAALQFLERIAQQAIETEDSITPMRTALITARNYDLSAYDGVYLDLAMRQSLPLATLDRALRTAAPRAGVQLF